MGRIVLSSMIVVALAATPAVAQDPLPQLAQPVFRSSASMVAVNVTVFEGSRLISGLGLQDFEVYEDGVKQQVQFFESRTVPLDVILLLDTSSSMADKIEVVRQAARGFMKTLRPGDRGAVVSFASSVNILQPLTADVRAIESAINSVQANGSTSLHNAIYVALKTFGRGARDSSDVRRQAIAVLSDGQDTASVVSFDDVLALARCTGVNIYTISLKSPYTPTGSDPRYFSDADHSMKTLARETGAQAFFPKSTHELNGVYGAIAGELSAQYSIAYAPTNSRNDGRFRRIIVRVISNPAFRLRARSGYTANSPRSPG